MSELSDLFDKPAIEWTAADTAAAVAFFTQHRGRFELVKKDGSLKRVRKAKEGGQP